MIFGIIRDMKHSLIMLFFAVSVLTAAVVAYLVVQDRKELARNLADKAEREVEKAQSVERQARIELDRVKAVTQQHEAETRKKESEKAASDAAREASQAEEATEAKRLQVAEAEKAAAALKAKAAADARAEAEAQAQKARHEKDAAVAKAKEAEAEAAKASELRAKSEADTLKIRHSLTELDQLKAEYANMIAETKALEAELEEMKRALTPEKTVNDLMIVGAEDEAATNRLKKAAAATAAMTFSTPGQLMLEREQRVRDDALASALSRRRIRTLAILEQLLDASVAEERPIDAKFYLDTIRLLYPDWQHKKDKETK